MPLRPKDRLKTTYTLLSTQKSPPRSVIVGRHEESPRYREANAVPGPNSYQTLKEWGTDPNRPGPRIGYKQGNNVNNKIVYEPQSMLGATLRSKNLDVPIYDPPKGMGEYDYRKTAAVMCGSHDQRGGIGDSNIKTNADGTIMKQNEHEKLPGPLSYHSEYGTIGQKARERKEAALRAMSGCSFGRRWALPKDNGVPGPGAYEENHYKTMSPFGADEAPRLGSSRRSKRSTSRSPRSNTSSRTGTANSSSRPVTSSAAAAGLSPYLTDSSRGKSMAGRWKDPRPASSPGPGEYTPVLPFIGSSYSRVPTLKGRLPHPFVDTLAAHDCAKSDFNHSSRGASRLKARVRAT